VQCTALYEENALRVLVADDDETIRALISRLFTRRGDSVQSVGDGAAAIVSLQSDRFDLLVLDLMMPRTDGIGVLQYIASMPPPPPRVIVMTAAAPSMTATVPRDHVTALITKPFDIDNLLKVAEEAMNSGSAPGRAAEISPPPT